MRKEEKEKAIIHSLDYATKIEIVYVHNLYTYIQFTVLSVVNYASTQQPHTGIHSFHHGLNPFILPTF